MSRGLRACPVLTVNKDTHGRMTEDKVPVVLNMYRRKAQEELVVVILGRGEGDRPFIALVGFASKQCSCRC